LSIRSRRLVSIRPFVTVLSSLGLLVVGSLFMLARFSYDCQRRLVIGTYLDLERTIVERTAATAERWFRSRLTQASIETIESEVFSYFVEPIRLFKSGDAWIYNRDYVIYDESSDFPDEYRGKPIDAVFRIQAAHGASHYEELVSGVLGGTDGTGFYVWLPEKGREWVAWKSFAIGRHAWTLGLSTPEPEILEYYGVEKEYRLSVFFCCAIVVICLVFAFLLRQWYRSNLLLAGELDRTVERLAAASAAKNDFIAVLSHELRNPLNAIIGLADLDLRAGAPPAIRGDLEVIRSSGRLLLGLVNDLLDLSKIEAGRMELEATDFDVLAELSSALNAFRPLAADKGLVLDAIVRDGAPRFVRGDPLRFGQVLMNLVGNAVKFTDRGAVLVELSAAEPPRSPGEGESRTAALRCEVSDTGVGIAPEKMPRLFSAFSQTDASVSRRYGGTGLGLAICKRLVELLGGEIAVESAPGEGSRFSFTVRFEPGSEAAVAPSRREAPVAAIAAPARPLDVLVVDDDPVNQAVARRYVERAGHRATVAGSAAAALALAASRDFDLVLVDLGLPDMDGLEAARRLSRARPPSPGARGAPRVATMTARSDARTREACAEAGLSECLAKPIDPDALGRLLAAAETNDIAQRAEASPGLEGGLRLAPFIDDAALLDRVGGDRALIVELMSIFLREREGRRADFARALANRDPAALRAAAHRLSGGALSLSALPLAEAAAALESACVEAGADASLDPSLAARVEDLLDTLDRTAEAARAIKG